MDAAPSLPMRGSRPHGAGSPSCISCFLNLGAEGKPQTEGLQRPRPRRPGGRGGCTKRGGGGGHSPAPLSPLQFCCPPDVVDRSSGTGMGSSPSSAVSLTGGLSFPGETRGSLRVWGRGGHEDGPGAGSPWLGLSDCDEFAFPVGVRAGLPFLQDYHCRTPKWENTDTNNT